MDSRSKFRPRFIDVEPPGDPGTKLSRFCGLTVKGRTRKGRADDERAGQPNLKDSRVGGREKPSGESLERPYRKPTQVGEASSLR